MAISKDLFQAEMKRDGAFRALSTNLNKGNLSPKQAEAVADAIFDLLIDQVKEARNETRRIDAVLIRLEAAARAGKTPAPGQTWRPKQSVMDALKNDLKAFHGWVVSLYETEITILDFLAPDIAAATHKNVSENMTRLMFWRKVLPLLIR